MALLNGTGLIPNIKAAYRTLCEKYRPGDKIYLIGFSRGAFTARSVAGLVGKIGLLNEKGLQLKGDQGQSLLEQVFEDYEHMYQDDYRKKVGESRDMRGDRGTQYGKNLELVRFFCVLDLRLIGSQCL